jgi:outer membrane protein TolC
LTLTTPLRGDEQFAVELDPAESAALAASKDLQALQCRDSMYAAGEKEAMAEKHPTLSLVASQQLFLNAQPFTSPGGFLGLLANIPLLDGGLARAEREEQQALRARNQDDIKQLSDGVQLEVHKYYLDLLSARKALEAADQAVSLAHESLRLATRRFEEGQGTGVEKTDAILALSLAETNREQARYQNDLAYYGLKKAMGQLLIGLN